jgi:hypothetical protein
MEKLSGCRQLFESACFNFSDDCIDNDVEESMSPHRTACLTSNGVLLPVRHSSNVQTWRCGFRELAVVFVEIVCACPNARFRQKLCQKLF